MLKTILITGAGGFLGKNLLSLIKEKHLQDQYQFLMPTSKELDLCNSISADAYFDKHQIDKIIHLAAICGGLGLNKSRPADLTHINNKMTVILFDAIRKHQIPYLIGMGSVCSFPIDAPIPFKEDDIWNGKSHHTNRGYAEAKKMLITTFQSHMEQYGLKGIILMPTNMFGYHDHFNNLQNNHVVPAMINKFVDAQKNNLPTVNCYGTGTATRDFVFCQSVCEAILICLTQELNNYEPINLGSGSEISIRDLAYMIKELTSFKGDIIFTGEVNDGQPRRKLDISRAQEKLKWTTTIGLREGLVATIKWYRENKL